ncbi:unnamed protein product, partial [Chrysoparadoxa australica]
IFLYLCLGSIDSSYGQGHKIDFTIKGLPDSAITVGYHMGNQKYALDTIPIKNESFSIQGADPLKQGLYFIYTPGYYFEFIVKEQVFSIHSVYGKGYEEVKVKGSEENQIFRDFQVKMNTTRKELMDLKAQLDTTQDSLVIIQKIKEKEQAMVGQRRLIAMENQETFLSAFLNLMQEPETPGFENIDDPSLRRVHQYNYYSSHYFDRVQLDNEALIRTPLLQPKVMKYFDQVIPQHPDTINQEIDIIFEKVGDSDELFRYWLISFYNKYQESKIMGMDKVVVHLMEDYFLSERADWLNEEGIEKIKEEVTFTKHSLIGNEAPTMELVDTLNQPFYFEQIPDPFVLLYFYDPDCGHCKKKTPVLVDEYDALRDLGIEVVAVCTVTDVERWKSY